MLLLISTLFQLLLLYHSSLIYQGTRKLNLGSNNIVWSDSRYVQLYGERYSFVVDLQANFDRFRNIANKTEANMTLNKAFRARGRTYQKSLEPKCSFQNIQSLSVHPKFITDSTFTYFVIQGDKLILGTLNNKCQLSTIDLGKPQASSLKQIYRIDDFYIGIRTLQTLYVIDKRASQITQQLDLTVCQTLNNNSQLKFTTNYYVSTQSLRFIITSKDGICIYQKLSQNADFNFIKQHKSYLNQYPSFAQINDSVAFIITNNCTQIKLNLQNSRNSIQSQQTFEQPIRDKIVGTADYPYYWSGYYYYRAHMYLQSGEDIYFYGNLDSDRFINNVTAPILSACGGNYDLDTPMTFALDADGIKLNYPPKTLSSVQDYKFDKIGCFTSKLKQGSSEYPVFAAGISNGELVVAYIQGKNDILFDTFKATLSSNFKVNSVLVGADYYQLRDKYSLFLLS